MTSRFLQGLFLSLLMLGLACKPPSASAQPETPAQWEARVQAAAEAAPSPFGDARLREYREGFLNGAQMVRASLEQHRSPYLPVLDSQAALMVPQGWLPPGASVVAAPLELEVDPGTGFEIRRIQGSEETPFPKGQVDGFSWALAHHGAALLRPVPRPTPPTRWEPWPSREPVFGISAPGSEVVLTWQPGLLLWQSQRKGFPVQRCWRRLPFQETPRRCALDNDCLWLETAEGQVAALALHNGAVRELLPAEALQKFLAQAKRDTQAETKELEAYRKALQQKAEAGDPKAMLALAHHHRGQGAMSKAMAWYRKAAEAGEPDAMIRLAVPLMDSERPEDKAQARQWIERAAQAGSAEAQTFLELLARSEAK